VVAGDGGGSGREWGGVDRATGLGHVLSGVTMSDDGAMMSQTQMTVGGDDGWGMMGGDQWGMVGGNDCSMMGGNQWGMMGGDHAGSLVSKMSQMSVGGDDGRGVEAMAVGQWDVVCHGAKSKSAMVGHGAMGVLVEQDLGLGGGHSQEEESDNGLHFAFWCDVSDGLQD
jgi:hypothetical protein